jgi:mannose-6-phosphate isomerase-like protein (cupin superfamily)
MNVRRVVTGHNAEGKAIVASDEEVEPVTVSLFPGIEFHRLWGADAAPSFPDDGSQPVHAAYFPPVGGFRFGLCSMPPATSAAVPDDLDLTAALAELEQKLPRMAAHMEPDAPGMHTTATVDYEYVLEGDVVLELDDGAEVNLRPGDAVVQNGTRHAWHNRGDTTARLVVVIVGANHAKVPRA